MGNIEWFNASQQKAYKRLNRLRKEIVRWHGRKFPDATLEEQKRKLKEEILEVDDCLDDEDEAHFYEEIADCFIAICGMRRFDTKQANIEEFDLGINYGGDIEKVVSAIVKKWRVNHHRKFIRVDGVYQHEVV